MKEKELYRENLELLCEKFPNRQTITLAETSTIVGINRKSLAMYIENGDFPGKKLGRKYVIPITGMQRRYIKVIP